eukprot:maker-scaffold_4-snap-gene-2.41-mRNA-1 protein AED:0.26 eAED:0.26 QI:68/1/1/1/0/0/2/407/389
MNSNQLNEVLRYYIKSKNTLILSKTIGAPVKVGKVFLQALTERFNAVSIKVLKFETLTKDDVDKYYDAIKFILENCNALVDVYFDSTFSKPDSLLRLFGLLTESCQNVKIIHFLKLDPASFTKEETKMFFKSIIKLNKLEEIDIVDLKRARKQVMNFFAQQIVKTCSIDRMRNICILRLLPLSKVFVSLLKHPKSLFEHLSLAELYVKDESELRELNKFLLTLIMNGDEARSVTLRTYLPDRVYREVGAFLFLASKALEKGRLIDFDLKLVVLVPSQYQTFSFLLQMINIYLNSRHKSIFTVEFGMRKGVRILTRLPRVRGLRRKGRVNRFTTTELLQQRLVNKMEFVAKMSPCLVFFQRKPNWKSTLFTLCKDASKPVDIKWSGIVAC